MPKVIVSKEARKDLEAIRAYICDELSNPNAAQHILQSLKKCVASLESMPGHTGYRYLICENYCVFYLTGDTETIVVRILHQRQDYLRALFVDR